MNRRGFLAGILAAGLAPAFVRAGSLMPVVTRPVEVATGTEVRAVLTGNHEAILDLMEVRYREAADQLARLIDQDIFSMATPGGRFLMGAA